MKLSKVKKILQEKFLDIILMFQRKDLTKGDKILITSTDGIGDVIVRQKLALEFLKRYGNEKIVVLCLDKAVPVFKKMGFENIIVYTRDHRKRVKGKLELIKLIDNLGIGEIASLEFDQHDIYIKYFKGIKKTAFHNTDHPEMDVYYDKHISRGKGSVLEDVRLYLKEYFGKEQTLEEVRPDFSRSYQIIDDYREAITIGIGANDRRKIASPILMADIIKSIRENHEGDIVLLGYGEREERIAQKIIELAGGDSIVNLVSKRSLDETIDTINSSRLYIGLDSGLYNFAFSLKKDIIALFEREHSFAHKGFEGIRILSGEKNIREKDYIEDPEYGTYPLNNISIEDLKKVLKECLKV